MRETELYLPIKAFLEHQGYEVKAEIGAADIVALRGAEPPVIVELKAGFSLSLFHQAIARQSVTDSVYVAVAHKSGRRFLASVKSNLKLARRLGLGLIVVRVADGLVTVQCDPAPFTPRKSKPKQATLLREFAKRQGDPNTGGQTRQGLVTAYRQDALRLALFLHENGAAKGAVAACETGVKHATRMMRDNHYGWFERLALGTYGLTPAGAKAAEQAGPALADRLVIDVRE